MKNNNKRDLRFKELNLNLIDVVNSQTMCGQYVKDVATAMWRTCFKSNQSVRHKNSFNIVP